MSDICICYSELDRYIKELESKFISSYIPAEPGVTPSDYMHDVRAYCLLAHAAFEHYIETVATEVANNAVNRWIMVKAINSVIPALLAWSGGKLKIDDNESNAETKPFDYLRPLIEEAKNMFSREVHNNHGVSVLYLRNLLIPVAIEIKQDANLLNSLKKLAQGRGEYAHKGRVSAVYSPEDAKSYVSDVLTLCDDIKSKALANLV